MKKELAKIFEMYRGNSSLFGLVTFLAIKAHWDDEQKTYSTKRAIYEVKKGELYTTYLNLTEWTGLNHRTLKKYLSLLERTGAIQLKTFSDCILIVFLQSLYNQFTILFGYSLHSSSEPIDISKKSNVALTDNSEKLKCNLSVANVPSVSLLQSSIPLFNEQQQKTPTTNQPVAKQASSKHVTPRSADGSASKDKETAEKIRELWNDFAKAHDLAPIRVLPKRRIELIKERLKELPDIKDWQTAINNIANSKHHLGVNDRGWKITFDFLIRTPGGVDKERLPAILRFFENQHTSNMPTEPVITMDNISEIF